MMIGAATVAAVVAASCARAEPAENASAAAHAKQMAKVL